MPRNALSFPRRPLPPHDELRVRSLAIHLRMRQSLHLDHPLRPLEQRLVLLARDPLVMRRDALPTRDKVDELRVRRVREEPKGIARPRALLGRERLKERLDVWRGPGVWGDELERRELGDGHGCRLGTRRRLRVFFWL